jgi:hypothetical protein
LWALPRQAKTYALALVETVEFLSETRPALPPAASGVGHVHDLRRRVTMIMQGTTPRTLSWSGLLALFGAGAFLLPVMPTWAQQPPPAADQIRLRFAAEEEDDKRDTNRKEIDKLSERMLIEQIAAKKREIAELEAKLKSIQGGKPAAEKAGTGDIRLWQMIDGKAVEVKPGEHPKIILELLQDPKAKPDQPKALSAEEELRQRKMFADYYRALKEQERPLVIEVIVDGKKQMIQLPPGSRIINKSETKPVPESVTPPNRSEVKPKEGAELPRTPGTPADVRRIKVADDTTSATDKRVAELEKKLADMMRELEGLRKDLKTNPGAPPIRALPVVPPAADPNSPRGR